MVSEWAAGCGRPVAGLSLDERDNNPSSFLTYLVAALQKVAPNTAKDVLAILQSPQPPPTQTALLNEVATIPDDLILILGDCSATDTNIWLRLVRRP